MDALGEAVGNRLSLGLRRGLQVENLCHFGETWRLAGLGDLICSDVDLVHLSACVRQPQLEALTVH